MFQAIKKISTKTLRKNKKTIDMTYVMPWHAAILDAEIISLTWSIPSFDTKSVDTYLTYVPEELDDCSMRCCCCCMELEENQRNENLENEMMIW